MPGKVFVRRKPAPPEEVSIKLAQYKDQYLIAEDAGTLTVRPHSQEPECFELRADLGTQTLNVGELRTFALGLLELTGAVYPMFPNPVPPALADTPIATTSKYLDHKEVVYVGDVWELDGVEYGVQAWSKGIFDLKIMHLVDPKRPPPSARLAYEARPSDTCRLSMTMILDQGKLVSRSNRT